MAKKPLARRGLRLSRPDSERFFTVMLVFTHRTFRWSLARQTMLWVVGTVAAFWAIAMIGSGYGFWATKKIMSFSQLQRETFTQQQQLRESLDQAQALDGEIQTLRRQMSDLLKVINPKGPDTSVLPVPAPWSRIWPRPWAMSCTRPATCRASSAGAARLSSKAQCRPWSSAAIWLCSASNRLSFWGSMCRRFPN